MMVNYQSLAYWVLLAVAICSTSQCSFISHSEPTQVDPSPDNISRLSRCERTCLDTSDTCGTRWSNYSNCLSDCADIRLEAELVRFERAYLCFGQNAGCDPVLYNQYCLMDGGI